MNLCSVQALKQGIQNEFSYWIWRHPPTFSLLTLLIKPLQAGFAERVEIVLVLISTLNLVILFLLNRKIYGKAIAIATTFLLAAMPASMLFNVWVKRDEPAVTFGLLAIFALISKRTLYAGIFVGIALLFKETGLFYASAIFLMWMCGAIGRRKLKDFLFLSALPLLIAGIWYLVIAPHFNEPTVATQINGTAENLVADPLYLRFLFEKNNVFSEAWYYYISLLPVYMGRIGAGLGIMGAGTLLWCNLKKKKNTAIPPATSSRRVLKLWPLFVLVPSITLLSIGSAKVAWIMTVLLPAWATLQGITVIFLAKECYQLAKAGNFSWKKISGISGLTTIAIVILFIQVSAYKQNYENSLKAIVPNQWRGAIYSQEAAITLNKMANDKERILMTSFHYWRGLEAGRGCPIFSYYFTGGSETFVRPYQDSFSSITNDILKEHIDWVLLSPPPGPREEELFGGFDKTLHLKPIQLSRAFLYNTTSLWDN